MGSPPELRRIRRVLYFYYHEGKHSEKREIREYESQDLTISLAARPLALPPPLIYLCGADFHTHPAAPRKYVVYVNFYLSYLCIASPTYGPTALLTRGANEHGNTFSYFQPDLPLSFFILLPAAFQFVGMSHFVLIFSLCLCCDNENTCL